MAMLTARHGTRVGCCPSPVSARFRIAVFRVLAAVRRIIRASVHDQCPIRPETNTCPPVHDTPYMHMHACVCVCVCVVCMCVSVPVSVPVSVSVYIQLSPR
jgi:hypothetical protein